MRAFSVNVRRVRSFASWNAAILLAGSLVLGTAAMAAPGDPDPSFGVNGEVSFARGGSNISSQGPVRQADGRYIVPFEATTLFSGNGFSGGIARFLANGSLDATFGQQGVVWVGRSTSAVMSGTDFFAAGVSLGDTYDDVWVRKFDTNGQPVTSFGTGGRTAAFNASVASGYASQLLDAVVLLSDGSIVAAGYTTNQANNGNLILLAKFTSAGVLDSSFGSGGLFTFSPTPASAKPFQMQNLIALADGSLIVSGANDDPGDAGFVAKVTAAGALDSGFATGGIYTVTGASLCPAIAFDGTGYLVGCSVAMDMSIFRLTTSGVLDPTFTATTHNLGTTDIPARFSILPGGKIIVAGMGNDRFALVGLNANGTLDGNFGVGGTYIAPEAQTGYAYLPVWNGSNLEVIGFRDMIGTAREISFSTFTAAGVRNSVTFTNPLSLASYFRVKALSGGKVMAAGSLMTLAADDDTDQKAMFTRLTANGSLDASFTLSGHADVSFAPDLGGAGVRDFAILANGDIVFTGDFNRVNPGRVGVGKILASGTRDNLFNAAGATPGYNVKSIGAPFARNLRVQGDGRILVLGLHSNASPFQFGLVRFNEDGTEDATWGTSGLALSAFGSNSNPRYFDLDASGRPVVVGQGSGQIRLARFTTTGALDTSFGTGGMSSFSLPAGFSLSLPNKIHVLPSGKLWVAFSGLLNGTAGVGVARFTDTGALDTTFGTSGFTVLSISNDTVTGANIFDMVVLPNGRVAATVQSANSTQTGLKATVVRFNPDGSIDTSFGSGGLRDYELAGNSQSFVGIDAFADGALVLSGAYGPGENAISKIMKTVSDPTSVLPVTSVSVTSSANPVQAGQSVTLTATVTGGPGAATGTVNFQAGAASIAGCSASAVLSGVATCTTSSLQQGSVGITADYSGDASRLGSKSPVFTLTVNAAPAGPAKKFDLNGDGRSDLLWRNEGDGSVQGWLMNNLSATQVAGLLPPGGYTITHIADLNGNGKADTIIRHTDGTTIAWLHDGLSVVGQATLFSAGSGWSVKHTADLNGDGKADLIVENTNGTVVGWLMDGLTVLGTATFVPAGTGWSVSRVGDLNGDGKADLIWQNVNGTVQAWLMNGLSATQTATFVGDGTGWSVKLVADMNGDGKADLVWQHTDGTVQAWLMDGTAVTQIASFVPAGTGWSPVLAGDLNADGRADLFWQHTDGRSQTWLMNGLSVSAIAGFVGAGPWSATHLVDLNGDNKMDVLWRNADGSVQAWLMDGLNILSIASLAGPGSYVVLPPRPL